MTARWAPFVNRRRPLLDEPRGAAKWSPPTPRSSGSVRLSAVGFPGFVGSAPLGPVMPSPLTVLDRVLQRPEELAEAPRDPRELPPRGRYPRGGGGPLAFPQRPLQPVQLRLAQQLLSPPLHDLYAHHP